MNQFLISLYLLAIINYCFRYTFSQKEAFKPEELKKLGAKREIKSTGEVTLESEYEKIKKV